MMKPGTYRSAGRTIAAANLAALLLAASPGAALAQSVSDYRLPGADQPRANPGAQGPVDSDIPVVRGPAPRPAQSASPSPQPGASAPPPSPSPAPSVQRPAPQRTTPAPARTSQVAPAAATSPEVALPPLIAPQTGENASPTLPPVSASPAPVAGPALPETAEPIDWRLYWPFLAAILAVLVAAVIAILVRRRRKADPAIDFEPPVVRQNQPIDPASPAETPDPGPVRADPAPARPDRGLDISLEAHRLSASLMATTLSYRLTLTNTTGQPLNALAIEGDMVAAHASLAPEQQIASSAQRLELRHAVVGLAAGESIEFSGEMRLPLTAITPIRSGDAAFFVPLARLRIEAGTTTGAPLVETQTYVIGEISDKPGAALRPFRLDLGPRIYQNVGQRAVG